MGEVRVTQDDRDAAANAWARRFGKSHFEDEIMNVFEGRNDQHPLVQDFARHRQAAEKAQQERDAGIVEDGYRCRSCGSVFVADHGDKVHGGHPDNGCTRPSWDKLDEDQQAAAIRSQNHDR